MLWRFGFASSTLDTLLSRDIPPSVEELMDEQDILAECKAQSSKLVAYLARRDPVAGLLHWVISGMDELDHEAALADSATFDQNVTSPTLFPSYRPVEPLHIPTVPGPGPDSPPLEPAKLADDIAAISSPEEETPPQQESAIGVGLGQGLERQQSRDEINRARYPQIATEILTSEVWTIPDVIMSNKDTLLVQFWDAVLPSVEPLTPSTESSVSRLEQSERERVRDEFRAPEDDERDRKRELIRGMWTRVNGMLINKRTLEMCNFIKTLPNIVERLIAKISSPAIQDLLIRLISSEELGATGMIEWLASEGLIPRLLVFLSPHYSPNMNTIAGELLKSIITLCAPSPFNPAGGNAAEQQPGQLPGPNGPKDNRLVRELVSEASVSTMVGFMVDDVELSDSDWLGLAEGDFPPNAADPFVTHPLPSVASAASSLSQICNILVELIRRNNSDFSEPHLFHTIRNRLMGLHTGPPVGEDRSEAEEEAEHEQMEKAMVELSGKMGIVNLRHVLTDICEHFGQIHDRLVSPVSQKRSISAQNRRPLTMERFRVVELYAELLHSSNMSILNRPAGSGPTYTADGVLSGGLAGLEALGEALEGDRNGEGEGEGDEAGSPDVQVTKARELPVSSSTDGSLADSDEVSDDEEILEHIDDETTPSPSPATSGVLPADVDSAPTIRMPQTPTFPDHRRTSTEDVHGSPSPTPPPASPADSARLRDVMGISETSSGASAIRRDSKDSEDLITPTVSHTSIDALSHVANPATTAPPSVPSLMAVEERPTRPQVDEMAPGDRLKSMYIEHHVLSTIVNLFFDHPNNDFMHHVVYDMLQQILNGRIAPGWNRELIVNLIGEAKLIDRILEAQKLNEAAIQTKRSPRLAYMGHVVLIADELVKFFGRCPESLLGALEPLYESAAWDAFVNGPLRETKARDTRPLAGGKPSAPAAGPDALASQDDSSDEEDDAEPRFGEPLARQQAQDGFVNRNEFNSFVQTDAEDDAKFWGSSGRRRADSSDEEEDDAGWLRPSITNLDGQGSDDDDFGAFQTNGSGQSPKKDDFDDDEAWGTFPSSDNADDPDNPFGDDNFATSFAPSVQPSSATAPVTSNSNEPLTPRDWASRFDEEFDEADLANVHISEAGPSRSSQPAVSIPAEDSLQRQIQLPEFEDSPVTERAGPWGSVADVPSPSAQKTTTSSGISAARPLVEEQDLSSAIVDSPPTRPADAPTTAPRQMAAAPTTATSAASKGSTSPTASSNPVEIPKKSPPPPSLPSTGPGSSHIHPPLVRSPSGSRPPTSPMTIPQRSPGSLKEIPSLTGGIPPAAYPSSGGSGSRATPRSPTTSILRHGPGETLSSSPLTRHRSTGSSGSSGSFGSPTTRVRRVSFGSSPNPALSAAATPDAPLGPGVHPDAQLTEDGMVEREIDGKMVKVPADEIVRSVEDAQDKLAESLRL